jgi:predicted permease
MRPLLQRVASLFRRRALDSQLDEELRFHLDMETEANRRRGMTAEAAEQAAHREFGGVAQTKEIYRDRRGLPMLELLLRDLPYGLRTLRRSPGFTAIAVLSLGLGIGANTAIFTLIDAVMLRSLPVRSPNELVAIGNTARPGGMSFGPVNVELFSLPLYLRLRDRNSVFTGVFASGRVDHLTVRIDGGGDEPIRGRIVSANFFDVLGVEPALGRTFVNDGDRPTGANPVVVIAYDYWQKRFARDPAVLGRTVKLNGALVTVVGVGSRGFTGEVVGDAADVWIPLSMQAAVSPGYDWFEKPDGNWLLLMGRLRRGVGLAQARAQIGTLAIQGAIDLTGGSLSADEARDVWRKGVTVEPGGRGFSALRSQFSRPLLTLMIVVGLVLLIACANVANLLLARATSRRKEISVRLAIGASRERLVRQLLTESVLLAALGGAAGLFLAFAGTPLFLRMAAGGGSPVPLDVHPNTAMLAFTAGISLLTGILFGLTPALRSTRVDLSSALKESGRGVAGNSGWRLGKLLVVAQVALSLLLLVGAGLFVRSLMNLETLDVGYSRSHIAVLRVDPTASGYPLPQQLPLTRRLLEHLRSIPGVTGVTVSENGIFGGTDSGSSGFQVEGYTSTRKEDLVASVDQIGPHYFSVVGVPILAGRDFDERDVAGSAHVAVINQTMARFYFGNRDPVGQAIVDDGTRYTIVGVAKDMKERALKSVTERRYYLPFYQITDRIYGFNFEMRTRGDAAQTIAAIRRETQAFDGNLKILSLAPVSRLIDQSITDERLIAELSGFFGALALLLAATGLYGVMAYAISRRASEIGLRMALGADRASVIAMVLRETFVLVAVGIAIGLPVSLLAARFIAASLAQVSASDPVTIGGATVVLLLVALVAGWVPAHRASRIDPLASLRME